MLRRLLLGTVFAVAVTVTVGGIVLWHYVSQWDAVVSEKFRTHRWKFPSKIYSDSFLVYPGMDLQAVGMVDRLHELGYQPADGELGRKGDYLLGTGHLDVYLHDLPSAGVSAGARPVRFVLDASTVTHIEALDTHDELYSVELDPALIGGLYEDIWEERHLVRLADVSPLLIRAIIDVEDQHFYEHPGVDVGGVLRAMWINLRSGSVVQGGSTLTQQLMKNFFLTDERSFKRKLRELLMALVVEHRFTKEEILENYLNEIYLGQKGTQGVYGVWEASQFYFSKQTNELTPAEAAMLAALIKAPNRYSPFRDPDRALRRRNYALTLMLKQGDLTAEQFAAAIPEPLRKVPAPSQNKDAPYFVDFVRQELSQTYPAEVLTTEGLMIETAIDMHLQHLAEQALQTGLAALESRHPRLHSLGIGDQLQACLIAVQPQTGAIKAMMGGRDYRSTQFNRCTQAHRQPGSVFKPFTYLAAFEQTRQRSDPITAITRLDDEPFEWSFDRQVWSPANYKKRYFGQVTVRQALELSLNAATARLAHEIGLAPIIEVAHRMGIESTLPPYPSVVLGAVEVTPFEVAQAFAVLANGGLRARPLSIKKVFDRSGLPIERNPVQVEQVVGPDTAYLVTHLMEGVIERGTGRGARTAGFNAPAAGKTGTTDDYRDAWFVGFTPNLLTVVWVGFDQNRAVDLSGAEAALPIWTEFMKQATAGLPPIPFSPPPGVAIVRIDPLSGLLATPECPNAIEEAFYDGQEPLQPCPLHRASPELPYPEPIHAVPPG